MAKKKQSILNVSFLLDMTGSMDSVKDATISGFNEYIGSLKADGKDIRFTLSLFNTAKITTLYKGVPLADVKPLNHDTYRPTSTTPLYDAVGRTVHETQSALGSGKQEVLFVVMTDGEENASHEYDRQKVFDLIKSKEKDGWTFAFLGANQDSWEVGKSIGVAVADSAMNYDANNPQVAFKGLAAATSHYADDPQTMRRAGVFSRVKSKQSPASPRTDDLFSDRWRTK